MPKKCIIYQSVSGSTRKITVIDGQPYYQSTGQNSGAAGAWLPFIMIRGTKPIDYQRLPAAYDRPAIEHLDEADAGYIIKYERTNLARKSGLLNIQGGRIPTKKTLITSSQLSGFPVGYERVLLNSGLTRQELKKAATPITLRKPEFQTTDVDKINQWLIKQGAEVPSLVLPKTKSPTNDDNIFANSKDLNFNVSYQTQAKIKAEIKKYIASRFKEKNGKYETTLFTKLFLDSDLTQEKLGIAQDFLKLVDKDFNRNCQRLVNMVSDFIELDQCAEEESNKLCSFTKGLAGAFANIKKILADEIKSQQKRNRVIDFPVDHLTMRSLRS